MDLARAKVAWLVVLAGLLVAACGGKAAATASSGCNTATGKAAAPTAGTSAAWPYSNLDLANTRDATGSAISSANVSRLAQTWTFKLTGKAATGVRPYGSLSANPIVLDGVVYLQDLDSNVYARARDVPRDR
jgi:glucose dehydrogenase